VGIAVGGGSVGAGAAVGVAAVPQAATSTLTTISRLRREYSFFFTTVLLGQMMLVMVFVTHLVMGYITHA
jgi:hypothetical protein